MNCLPGIGFCSVLSTLPSWMRNDLLGGRKASSHDITRATSLDILEKGQTRCPCRAFWALKSSSSGFSSVFVFFVKLILHYGAKPTNTFILRLRSKLFLIRNDVSVIWRSSLLEWISSTEKHQSSFKPILSLSSNVTLLLFNSCLLLFFSPLLEYLSTIAFVTCSL